jgi:hypothetical protein
MHMHAYLKHQALLCVGQRAVPPRTCAVGITGNVCTTLLLLLLLLRGYCCCSCLGTCRNIV